MADPTILNDQTQAALDPTNQAPQRTTSPDQPEAEESLLNMEPAAAAKQMLKEWDDSWKQIQPFTEQWRVNRARSQGYTGVALIKRQDRSEAYIPLNAKKSVAGLNKAARLSR